MGVVPCDIYYWKSAGAEIGIRGYGGVEVNPGDPPFWNLLRGLHWLFFIHGITVGLHQQLQSSRR